MGMGVDMSDRTAPRGLGPFDPYSMEEAGRARGGRRRGWVWRAALGLMAGIGFVGAAALGAAPASAPNPDRAPAAAASGEIADPIARAAVRARDEETARGRATRRGSTAPPASGATA